MATALQHRRGTTAQHSSFTGAAGEITVDTTKNTAVVHDGSTAGGTPLMKESGTTGAVNFATSSGNVGIGTSSPGYRLDVAAADTTAGLGYAARLRSNATAAAATLQFTNSGVTTENGLVACTDSGVLTLQGSGASSAVVARTNGNERIRIDSSGNVGIGTSSPGQKLTVAGTIESTSGGVKFPDGTTQTTAATGGWTQIASTAFVGSGTTFSSIPTTYNDLLVVVYDVMNTYGSADNMAVYLGTSSAFTPILYYGRAVGYGLYAYASFMIPGYKKDRGMLVGVSGANASTLTSPGAVSMYSEQTDSAYWVVTGGIARIKLMMNMSSSSGGTAVLYGR